MKLRNKILGVVSTLALAVSANTLYEVGKKAGIETERERARVEEMRNNDWESFSNLFYGYALKDDVDDVVPYVDERELRNFYHECRYL